MTKMTIRELITTLEGLAETHGEETLVAVYDDYTANEGWDYEEEDLYCTPRPALDDEMGVIVL
jgi:hypothetical protein